MALVHSADLNRDHIIWDSCPAAPSAYCSISGHHSAPPLCPSHFAIQQSGPGHNRAAPNSHVHARWGCTQAPAAVSSNDFCATSPHAPAQAQPRSARATGASQHACTAGSSSPDDWVWSAYDGAAWAAGSRCGHRRQQQPRWQQPVHMPGVPPSH